MSGTQKRLIDSAAARAEAKRLSNKVLVGGSLVAAETDATIDVIHPPTMEVIATVPRCGAADAARAVEAAAKAFPVWSRIPARERGRLIAQAADRIEAELETLSQLQTLETGHPIASQSRGDMATAVDMLRMFAGVSGELKGETVPDAQGVLHYTTCEPIGVIAAVIPWNGPVFTLSAKIAPALVAGNTIVVKSAETAPLAVLRCAEIIQSFLPPGAINMISGVGEEVGKPLVQHPAVRKATFTGSVNVGKLISQYVADKLIPVTLELGGKNPNIVMADADLALAIPGVVAGMRFMRQGQSCIAGSRILIQDSIYDEVVEGAVKLMNALVVGDPFDENTEVGTIISQKQMDRIQSFVSSVKDIPGARVLCGGSPEADSSMPGRLFMRPTLIDNVPHDAPLCQEEIFGPVAVAVRFTDFEDAIRIANDSVFGLAAAMWTRDLGTAMQFAARIEAGLVQVNQYAGPRANVSYGGLKVSGLGKEYTLQSMLNHFTRSRTIQINAGLRS
jgi:acyl-CoA reductase-like NAD-dependent aldehyde dehydrogenase